MCGKWVDEQMINEYSRSPMVSTVYSVMNTTDNQLDVQLRPALTQEGF